MSVQTLIPSPSFTSTESSSPFDTGLFDEYVMATYGRFPLTLVRGEGCRVWDDRNQPYLDFVAGIATCTLGHANPVMVEAATRQMQTLHHVSNLYYIPQQGELAQWLVEHSCANRVFFCNSGAEANEGAIKLARKQAHVKRGIENPVIITAHASFHGRTLATITATGQPKYQKNFAPLVPGFHYVPYNDITALESAIADLDRNGPQVAAIMMEALQGEGGVNPGDRAYFQRVRDICDETGILLILDEVQVGMGRTGKMWGYENLGIEPDIFTSAKGLGGGVPIGALLAKTSADVFAPGDHASTFGGNPFVCGIALAVCHAIEDQHLMDNAQQRGEQLRLGLAQLAYQYPLIVAQSRGWGLIQGLLIHESAGVNAIDLVKECLQMGLLLVPAGPQVVRFVPPLIVTAAEMDEALSVIDRALAKM